jgi:tetratricopeptide (TPR) repeat protein
MTRRGHELFHSRSSSRQFLLYNTDAKPEDNKTKDVPLLDSNLLSKTFPDILFGETFINYALSELEPATKFEAMVIRIDDISSDDKKTAKNHSSDLWVDVAKTIDTLCKRDNGIWGQLEQDRFGCFLPDQKETSGLKLAENIQKNLAGLRKETVSIGLAAYPTINFSKAQTLDNARKAIDHAEFFGPNSTVAFDAVSLNISGDTLYQKGKVDEAIKEFKAALMLDPANGNVSNSLGVCYGVLGDYGKALEEFEKAIQYNPEEAMAFYNAGIVNMLTEKRDKALEYFLTADSKEEDIFEVSFQIGKLYLELGQPEKGKIFLEKAVKIRPDSGPAFRYLGECFAAMNMTDEAVSMYKKAVRQNPNDAHSLSALGYLFDLQGENPEITTIFCQQSVDISPENGLFRHRLGNLYLKRNQLEDALEQFQRADELGHDSKALIKQITKLMGKA